MIYSDGPAEQATLVQPVSPERSRCFSLSDEQVEALARQALIIEQHYNRPMDIEWALDGIDEQIYIVQARPETVKSRADRSIEQFQLSERGKVLVQGRAIGQKIGQGTARVIMDARQMSEIQPGDVLVTDMTDPDWEPVMKRASVIVTNRGGRTCHAAIIARELGIPAVVGCKQTTTKIGNDRTVTVSCAEGDIGLVFEELLPFQRTTSKIDKMPELPVKIMLNIGNPAQAFAFSHLPNDGVGLARLEFIINNIIGIHPKNLFKIF